MNTPDFSKVTEIFESQLKEKHLHPAAQVAVYHHGELVMDLFGNQPGTPAISAETPFLTFSVSKIFTTAAILRLIDEGRVELDAPVGRYWPEFAQKGKETATIRHTLLHQAGVPAPHLNKQIFSWPNWGKVTTDLAKEEAQYVPGTQTSYHLVNFGFILGEVVRRVTGQPIDQYLLDQFFKPMGLNHTSMKTSRHTLLSSPKVVPIAKEMKQTAFIFNFPAIRRALMPAASLRSTARELGAFFTMLLNGGNYQGSQYLSPEIIRLATRSHYNGYDSYLKFNLNWGLGFIIGGGKFLAPSPRDWIMGWGSSENTFAGCGMGTCMVWADHKADVVMAFTCNGMLGVPAVDQRWAVFSNAIWDSLIKFD